MVRALTDRGAQGIPFLIDKLEEERDESIILHIIYAFECYMSFGKYNVKDDQRAIDTIEMAIRRVRTSHVKTNAMEMLQDIKK